MSTWELLICETQEIYTLNKLIASYEVTTLVLIMIEVCVGLGTKDTLEVEKEHDLS